MGVRLEPTGGKRNVSAELNLVPFIDLLTVCITFLLTAAVWVELNSLPVDQAVACCGAPAASAPPLTLWLRAGELRITRGDAVSVVERIHGAYAWARLDAALAADRAASPDQHQVVIVTDDGLAYGDMVHALDLSRAYGYDQTLLGGG